jgi:hypothetical protein
MEAVLSDAVGRVVVEDGLARMEPYEPVQRLHEKMQACCELQTALRHHRDEATLASKVTQAESNRASGSGRPRARHILQYSKAELRSMGWRGETYFSRSQGGRPAPYIEDKDSDSDYEYDDLTSVPEHELADSWREASDGGGGGGGDADVTKGQGRPSPRDSDSVQEDSAQTTKLRTEAEEAVSQDPQRKLSKKARKGAKGNKVENLSQISGAIAGLPLVAVLELGSITALPVLSSWYSKQQNFLLAMNKMLDLKPARLEQETRLQKMKKLQEAGQGLYDQESQLQKEMAGRKNQASIENLVQQIFKSKRACTRHAKGTHFQEAVEEMLHPDLSAQACILLLI